MWKQVCGAWYSVAPNVLEELLQSNAKQITDLIKAKGGATKYMYRLHGVGVHVCCCVCIKMYMSNTMSLCSHWNEFNIYTQILSVYLR